MLKVHYPFYYLYYYIFHYWGNFVPVRQDFCSLQKKNFVLLAQELSSPSDRNFVPPSPSADISSRSLSNWTGQDCPLCLFSQELP